ncbi:hypothetical protein BCR33DRAFT_711200 [Rhizoclosmatium globosum]|uniref:Uncharacterized protein n=1 Tax=Rhizoclosmatium globosum TaxID=329046 RepID=A0A1Y2D3K0_9FUNG|nr:hypothetical protein BCR33DRAFT_711200 [Rhizoclosmatium globosum]|eukprot:ORY53861.1 hypothetical protein BCR33DRAFT_711200 [Rhizoclosmatium globosum]
MNPEQFLLETQSLFPPLLSVSQQAAAVPANAHLLYEVYERFKHSLRQYLLVRRIRGLRARKHFLRVARIFSGQQLLVDSLSRRKQSHHSSNSAIRLALSCTKYPLYEVVILDS